MKAVILAGGLGTRLSEQTDLKPKPMVEIGHRPILWHIMKHYAHYGVDEFFIALGYKGEVIKKFFLEYQTLVSDLTVHTADGAVEHRSRTSSESWKVHLIDTGHETNTGGRLKRLERYLLDETFLLTYGDGVSNVPIDRLLAFHRENRRIGTLTAVRPPARFGGLLFDGPIVSDFQEKPQIGEGWINGGFMVFEPQFLRYLEKDSDSLESDALTKLTSDRQLCAYRHDDFWQCMDTLRELRLLERLWQSGSPPWRVWK